MHFGKTLLSIDVSAPYAFETVTAKQRAVSFPAKRSGEHNPVPSLVNTLQDIELIKWTSYWTFIKRSRERPAGRLGNKRSPREIPSKSLWNGSAETFLDLSEQTGPSSHIAHDQQSLDV
ncbi:hypothetical protein RRG08_010484 [Elysia crispata]|uniref:Uncharacterized protein n=1 Tax=Elysia crispata TaxID=231223 RepID=A0AAE1APQ4_9GAST|nr:hypothetical protein RRG08_010484 [Elysia crispata]